MADTFIYVQAQPFSLAGAGAVIGATTVVLKSFAGIDGTLLTMADFGTIGFGTLEPGNGTLEEQICFTGVTQNSNGTATLTGVKNVSFVAPYTQTSGLAKTHAGSTEFVISNTSGFYDKLTSKSDDETITGKWTFPSGANRIQLDADTDTSVNEELVTFGQLARTALAGAVKATVSVFGLVRMSVAPASAADPIAVSDNDTRVPPINTSTMTANQVSALTGTGTPNGTTGKYVTDDDTSSTPSANKVVRYDASAELAANSLLTTLICGETLAVGDPVAATLYQADGGVLLDAKTSVSSTSTNTLSTTITVANQTNRTSIVIIGYSTASGFTTSGVTFDSVAMTNILNNVSLGSSRFFSAYRLTSPNVGATKTVTATFTGTVTNTVMFIYDYYNTDITTPGTSYAAQVGATNTITPVVNGSLALSAFDGSIGTPVLNGNDLSNTTTVDIGGTETYVIGDSGIVPNTTTFTSTSAGGGGVLGGCYVVIKPATAPVFGYAKKSSASSTTNAIQANLYDTFTGFVKSVTGGGVLGQTATISVGGVVTGLTSLTPLETYYLANTSGTISTTAGTNSKKIGTALTTTSLLIKQDN